MTKIDGICASIHARGNGYYTMSKIGDMSTRAAIKKDIWLYIVPYRSTPKTPDDGPILTPIKQQIHAETRLLLDIDAL